jgi:hypothetical protein
MEAVLSPGGSVTCAAIAAGSHENRHDIEPEADGAIHRCLLYVHRNVQQMIAVLHLKSAGAVGDGIENISLGADDAGRWQNVFNVSGNIAGYSIWLDDMRNDCL